MFDETLRKLSVRPIRIAAGFAIAVLVTAGATTEDRQRGQWRAKFPTVACESLDFISEMALSELSEGHVNTLFHLPQWINAGRLAPDDCVKLRREAVVTESGEGPRPGAKLFGVTLAGDGTIRFVLASDFERK